MLDVEALSRNIILWVTQVPFLESKKSKFLNKTRWVNKKQFYSCSQLPYANVHLCRCWHKSTKANYNYSTEWLSYSICGGFIFENNIGVTLTKILLLLLFNIWQQIYFDLNYSRTEGKKGFHMLVDELPSFMTFKSVLVFYIKLITISPSFITTFR